MGRAEKEKVSLEAFQRFAPFRDLNERAREETEGGISDASRGGRNEGGGREITDLGMTLNFCWIESDDLESVERGGSGEGDVGWFRMKGTRDERSARFERVQRK